MLRILRIRIRNSGGNTLCKWGELEKDGKEKSLNGK
jgi:hypothetical protein